MVFVALVVVVVMRLAEAQTTSFYDKVVPNFPSDVANCVLQEHPIKHPSLIKSCAALCNQLADCILFCLTGTSCTLLSALVNGRWPGDNTASAITYGKCYSSWYPYTDDLTPLITASFASSQARAPEKAYSGFYCFDMPDNCFTTQRELNPWFRADLGASRTVSSIVIYTRADGTGIKPESFFNNVVITLGDSSDYNNAKFATYPTEAPVGDFVVINSQTPHTGRYLQLRSELAAETRISFCDLLILP